MKTEAGRNLLANPGANFLAIYAAAACRKCAPYNINQQLISLKI